MVTPNSDTPYSMLWLDLRAEPMVISVPAVDKKRYYSVQLIDGNTYNYGYIGSRATGNEAGDYLVVGPDWTGRDAGRHQAGVPLDHAVRPDHLPHPAVQRRPTCRTSSKVQAGYKAQPLSAFLKQPAPPAAPAIDFPPATTAGIKDELLRLPRRRAAVRARNPGRQGDPRAAGQHRHRPGQDASTSRTCRPSTRPRSCWP